MNDEFEIKYVKMQRHLRDDATSIDPIMRAMSVVLGAPGRRRCGISQCLDLASQGVFMTGRRYISTSRVTSLEAKTGTEDVLFDATNAIIHRNQQSGRPKTTSGSLKGWATTIKDNICTADMPTACASRMLQGYMSPFDATVVSLLREAGADLIGKTNCDEFGMGSSNTNSLYGPVINPASPEGGAKHVAGGSSGGAAASVATGEARL